MCVCVCVCVHTCTCVCACVRACTCVPLTLLSFAGYFDQQFRSNLFTSWASHLQQASITFRPDLARVEVSVLQGSYHFSSPLNLLPSFPPSYPPLSLTLLFCLPLFPLLLLLFPSTFPMLMSVWDGRPMPYQPTTCAQRMPS